MTDKGATLLKLRCLNIDESEKEAYFLGYPMRLTPTEFKILYEIAQAESIDVDNLSIRCGLAELSRGNISVHICAINRKAEMIGKRKLILFKDSNYCLNEFM